MNSPGGTLSSTSCDPKFELCRRCWNLGDKVRTLSPGSTSCDPMFRTLSPMVEHCRQSANFVAKIDIMRSNVSTLSPMLEHCRQSADFVAKIGIMRSNVSTLSPILKHCRQSADFVAKIG